MSSIQSSTLEAPNSSAVKNELYTNDSDTSPLPFTGVSDERIPEGGDELSRFETTVEASRTLSRMVTGASRLLDQAKHSDKPLATMGGGRSYPPALPDRDAYMVSFDGPDDPTHPHNYPFHKKFIYSACAAFAALVLATGSAIFAEAATVLEAKFSIGPTVATLTTSFYVLGFATGPVVWGPLCELYGRKPIFVITMFGFTLFNFAVATAKDLQTIMLARFFAGFFGGASLVIAPAIMTDLFSTKSRGKAIAIFAMLLFGGPMLGPILGGFIVKNSTLGWRWTCYFLGIFAGTSTIIIVFFLEETHHPLILVAKAETLRRRTGNWGILAPHEEVNLSIKEICEKNITRPIVMLCTEPILGLVTLYNAFIYGMLYLFLTAIPFVFEGKYHWALGVAQLPYLSMLIGVFVGGFIMLYFERVYGDAMDNNGGKPIPEKRLLPMMFGANFFVIGLFWLGWTGQYGDKIHFMVPTVAASFVGAGLILIFLPCLNYIIDCYLFLAASAIAANTFLRSLFGAAFPLFARQMFTNLDVNWACTLLGCLSVLMIPVPFVFYRYGKFLRGKSKYAFDLS